jgi:hypothetical protein
MNPKNKKGIAPMNPKTFTNKRTPKKSPVETNRLAISFLVILAFLFSSNLRYLATTIRAEIPIYTFPSPRTFLGRQTALSFPPMLRIGKLYVSRNSTIIPIKRII